MSKAIYIRANDEKTYNEIVVSAVISPWAFGFPGNLPPKYEVVKKNYHGNSKILLRLFHNDITGRYEIEATTASIEKSFPQVKSVLPLDWDEVSYELVCSVFGEVS